MRSAISGSRGLQAQPGAWIQAQIPRSSPWPRSRTNLDPKWGLAQPRPQNVIFTSEIIVKCMSRTTARNFWEIQTQIQSIWHSKRGTTQPRPKNAMFTSGIIVKLTSRTTAQNSGANLDPDPALLLVPTPAPDPGPTSTQFLENNNLKLQHSHME